MMPLMRTTTLVVNAPIDHQLLDSRFKLVRYDMSDRYPHFAKNANKAYERLQVAIRSQLWQPFRTYFHDTLGPSPFAIYVLYEGTDPVRSIALPMLNAADLPRRTVSFGNLPPHMVLKLLQAHYFGQDESTRFTSQGKHFLLARAGARQFVGLEVDIKGARANNEEEGPQVYHLSGHATRFIQASPAGLSRHQLYTSAYVQLLSPKGGQYVLSVVPPDKVQGCPNPLFRIHRESSSRPTLEYHAQRNYKQTRGYLLATFISAFSDYLAQWGINVAQASRDFTQHRVDKKYGQIVTPAGLPICLLDQRLNQQEVTPGAYHALLTQTFPHYTFVPVPDLLQSNRRPTLILHDATAEAFTPGGSLAGEPDPYQLLYRRAETVGWPKQSICVNPHDGEKGLSRETYLSYPCCDFSKPNGFRLRFEVCLNQLVLKQLVLNDTPIVEWLPFMAATDSPSLQSYIFVRRQTYQSVSYTVLLFFEAGRAMFLNLNAPEAKARRDSLLAGLGLNWMHDVIAPWRVKHGMEQGEGDAKTPYLFILGSGLVVEVEDCDEHVLYNYDTMRARQEAVEQPVQLADLKLAPHYDDLRTQKMVPLARLVGAARSEAPMSARAANTIQASAQFYDRLKRLDAFLDELAAHHRRISFNALTRGENGDRLEASIFAPDEVDARAAVRVATEFSTVRTWLKRLYQRRGMFLSDKASDVQYSQGIWFDPEGRFMVGSPDQMKFDQARAHRIRRFHAYRGGEHFPLALFLNTLGVLFVRPEQYTVYPYPFHLIDQYVETRLHWETTLPSQAATRVTP